MSCDDCFKSVAQTGKPVGHSETIAGVETYVTEPGEKNILYHVFSAFYRPPQKKVLLFFADIFSPFYLNNQLLQDWFASNGYTVLGLDYFFGDRVEELMKQPDFDQTAWLKKVTPKANECTPRWVEAVRQRYGTTNTKYFAVGYCFGGPYLFALADDPTFNLVAGAVAHPASIYDSATKQLKPGLIENCVAPIVFGCAEIDYAFPTEARRQAEDILAKNKAHYYFQIFSGVSHGFSTRGNLDDDIQRFAKEECARGFLCWFNKFAA